MGGDGWRWEEMGGDGRRWVEMGGEGRRWEERVEMGGGGRRWEEMGGDGVEVCRRELGDALLDRRREQVDRERHGEDDHAALDA
jgi:hypothetical protein